MINLNLRYGGSFCLSFFTCNRYCFSAAGQGYAKALDGGDRVYLGHGNSSCFDTYNVGYS